MSTSRVVMTKPLLTKGGLVALEIGRITNTRDRGPDLIRKSFIEIPR